MLRLYRAQAFPTLQHLVGHPVRGDQILVGEGPFAALESLIICGTSFIPWASASHLEPTGRRGTTAAQLVDLTVPRGCPAVLPDATQPSAVGDVAVSATALRLASICDAGVAPFWSPERRARTLPRRRLWDDRSGSEPPCLLRPGLASSEMTVHPSPLAFCFLGDEEVALVSSTGVRALGRSPPIYGGCPRRRLLVARRTPSPPEPPPTRLAVFRFLFAVVFTPTFSGSTPEPPD